MPSYPAATDYISAVQSPQVAFSIPALQTAQFALDPNMYVPVPASGNAAVVFRATVNGSDRALRFYTSEEDADTHRRYTALGRHLSNPQLRPCVATATWIDNAITIRQQQWPMVDMEWVDGRTLDDYVNFLATAGHADALGALAYDWRALIGTLQNARFAHGDLQHGNVLVDSRSKLRLVDFDGSWIESFRGMRPPGEDGHPNYQRKGREWGRWMDTFPGLVVYAALLGLSRNPSRWSEDSTHEKILFSEKDFAPPFRTPTWERLAAIGDPQVTNAIAVLKRCCEPNWIPTGSLEDLLSVSVSVPVSVPADPSTQPTGPIPRPTIDPAAPWWVKTGAAPPNPVKLPRPPEAQIPLQRTQPPAAASHTGTTPVNDWYQHLRASTANPPPNTPRGQVPPSWPPKPPPVTRPTTRTAPPARKSGWGRAVTLSIVWAVLLGGTTAIVLSMVSQRSNSVVAGIVVGVVFGALMLVILRPRP